MDEYTTKRYPVGIGEPHEPAESALPIEPAADARLGSLGIASDHSPPPIRGKWSDVVRVALAEAQAAFDAMQAAEPTPGAAITPSAMQTYYQAKALYEKRKARVGRLQALSLWSSLPVVP